MIPETVILYLFVAASLLAVVANRLRIPYTVALVLGGLLLGTLHLFPTPVLTHDLLFSIFLPGLVFESAYHLSASALWRDRLAIFGLAVPGVLTSIVVTAFVFLWTSRYLPDLAAVTMPLGVALVFGATVAATDPISVLAIFRELQAPQRLTFLVESESLLNDGTAIVFFTLFLAIAMGKPVTASALAVKFLAVVGGGVLIGAIVGWLSSEVIKRVNDGMVEITFTILAAYGSFLVAMQLGYSGVISTVVAGLICGNYGAKRGMAPSVRLAVNTFWEYIGFALNSLVFLLVGLTIRLPDLLRIWPLVIAAYVAITIARGAVIYSMGALLSRSRARMPWSWNFVLIWGGIRGALSMVLVLSLPQHFPFREMLINLVFGVVLLTILIQGLSISPVARALGV
ncbi:MAG: cation:proton antiporter, partial [Gammaproteobacteria bacterium]|nr:cation:proton antiporter [Gammaproteobacteria bacterium]